MSYSSIEKICHLSMIAVMWLGITFSVNWLFDDHVIDVMIIIGALLLVPIIYISYNEMLKCQKKNKG